MVHSLQKLITAVTRVATVAGLCMAVTGCVLPPPAHYGNAYPQYASATVVMPPRPVFSPMPQVFVPPRPMFKPQPSFEPVMPAPALAPRGHEGGWGWNTKQRERLERRFDNPRHVF
jgi:hypothetical protein